MNPQFPLYIVSKGRAESRLTSKRLEAMRVPYSIIVEEQEHDEYAAVIDPAKILVLDPQYQANYDTFSDLGADKGTGSGPARNFAWEHSIAAGHDWHWVMDDNIRIFYRLIRNRRVPLGDGTGFRVMEDFVLRYRNVSMAGPQYKMFAPSNTRMNPFALNTRIYSCNLIRNDVEFRWRGRYNEDTDLSLQMMKAGWVTVQFNAFLQDKITTQKMAGGNTDLLYEEGTLKKSQMLRDMHPDVTKLVMRYGRPHHYVDYMPFKKHRLLRKPDAIIKSGIDNYGMELVDISSK